MPIAAILLLLGLSALLAGVMVFRPITIHPGGKILAFGVLFSFRCSASRLA
jgi:hypothetical protein